MKYLISNILLLFVSLSLLGQQSKTFQLIDSETGVAIVGATIFYGDEYAVSDEIGMFLLNMNSGTSVQIVVSHVGYEPTELLLESNDEHIRQIAIKSNIKLLEEVLISTDQRPLMAQRRLDQDEIMKDNPKNVGDIFGNKSGFGIVKRGGYAMDPVFRSFKYEQLNLIYDGGVYISNACPNRMDPASTQISPAEIDRIELVKGPYTVRYGQTMGGLINIITNRPPASEMLTFGGELEGGYEVNGNGITGRGALTAVSEKFDLSLQGGAISFDDYKNGNGDLVPSSFSTYNYAVKAGLNPSSNQRLQLSWRQSFGKDISHASLPMDSPKDNSSVFVIDYGIRLPEKTMSSLNVKGYYTFVDHLMTNEQRPNFKMVEAVAPVTSTTYGGRVELGWTLSEKTLLKSGVDLRSVSKAGERYRTVKMMNGNPVNPPKEFVDNIWQDSWQHNGGAFLEAHMLLSNQWELLLGGRVDYVTSGIDDPAEDFVALYGTVDPVNEVNTSLTSSLNYNFGENGLVQLSLGRGTRAPDLTERYINHFNVGMDAYEYVGDPNLKSEINNQVDLTYRNGIGKTYWNVGVFYSLMQHYISAVVDESLPRKYMPMNEPRFAKRFVNLDRAWQTGFDAEIGFNLTNELSMLLGGYYTFAHNDDFDEPLPEIPPLTGLASIRYSKSNHWVEFKGRIVAEQDRVADSFDEQSTPGFSVFDLMGGYTVSKNFDVTLALKNIFNANYFEHLSRPYRNQSETGMFYEPGRSMRIGLKMRF